MIISLESIFYYALRGDYDVYNNLVGVWGSTAVVFSGGKLLDQLYQVNMQSNLCLRLAQSRDENYVLVFWFVYPPFPIPINIPYTCFAWMV